MSSAIQPIQFERLCRDHHASVLREAFRLTKNHADAWDLVQDTYERGYRSFGFFRPGTNFFAWLRTVMTRLFIDDWRRRRARPHQVSVHDVELAAPEPEELAAWQTVSTEALQQAMTVLPDGARRLLMARTFEGESYASLADRFELPIKTVGSQLFRTRDKLRAVLNRAA